MKMHWIQLEFSVSKSLVTPLSDTLENTGALSVTYKEEGDHPIYEPTPGETRLWPVTRVTGLYAGEHDIDEVLARIALDDRLESVKAESVTTIENQDWIRAFEQSTRPILVGDRLCICPEHCETPSEDRLTITLDPGIAFGTGSHPTTAMCLMALETLDLGQKTIIDYGCGSGILGIAALKLGADHVIAIDHDPQALIATGHNAERNGCEERITPMLPDSKIRFDRCDVLVANILANPLITLAESFSSLVKPGGALILSGILVSQREEVWSSYRRGFDLDRTLTEEDWSCVVGKKNEH